jgi:Concanavalin A-like lectin/glucanases superfamily
MKLRVVFFEVVFLFVLFALLTGSAFAARSLDGSTQVIFSSNCCATIPSGTAISTAAWIYETGTSASVQGVTQAVNDQFPGFYAYGVRLNASGAPQACINGNTGSGSTTCVTGTALSLNTWHHLGMVWDAASTLLRLYVDGAQIGTAVSTLTTATFVLPVGVGANYSGGSVESYFTGRIAEAAIWGVALSAAEMSALAHGTPPSLVRPSQGPNTTLFIYWPMHGLGSTEGNFADITGAVNNGGLTNAPPPAPHCACGMPTGEGH